ncbi:MAG TPA: glutathione S-transferase family protein [Steroidobacteraceae bacterium]|jgi:glutathione S-transferase
MALTLYMHPLASFCHKVLLALYENATPFESHQVDLSDATARQAFRAIWPFAKFPLLRDSARSQTVPESTIIIEYLERYYPGPLKLLPTATELALQVRATDRFYDLHVHEPMQKIVGDKLRPADGRDRIGVDQAWEQLQIALQVADTEMGARPWAAGDQFSMADCAAGPPLFFVDLMMPLARPFPHVSAYLGRLTKRPSYVRVLAEAQPYLELFPGRS